MKIFVPRVYSILLLTLTINYVYTSHVKQDNNKFHDKHFYNNNTFVFPKCCPEKQSLVNISSIAVCHFTPTIKSTLKPYILDSNATKVKNKICKKIQANSYCVDSFFHEHYTTHSSVALKCEKEGETLVPKILSLLNDDKNLNNKTYKINICCAPEEVFNFQTRACKKNEKDLNGLIQLMKLNTNFVEFHQSNAETCINALADYEIELTDLEIKNDVLKVKTPTDYMINLVDESNPWCLDASMLKNHYVIRTCKPRLWCKSHVCFHKCSHFNATVKMMDNGQLVEFPRKETLYNAIMKISSGPIEKAKYCLLRAQNFGLRQNMTCRHGFVDFPYKWDMDIHGHLHEPGQNKTIERHYCFDMFDNGSNEIEVRMLTCKAGYLGNYMLLGIIVASVITLIILIVALSKLSLYCLTGSSSFRKYFKRN